MILHVTFEVNSIVEAVKEIRHLFHLSLKEAHDVITIGADFEDIYRPFMEYTFNNINKKFSPGYFKYDITSGKRGGISLYPSRLHLDIFNANKNRPEPSPKEDDSLTAPFHDLDIISSVIREHITFISKKFEMNFDKANKNMTDTLGVYRAEIENLTARCKSLEDQVELLTAVGGASTADFSF